MKTYDKVMEKLEQLNVYPVYYPEYATESLEPNKQGIIVGNWNNCPIGLADALEKHFDLAYEDEYIPCSECGKLIRTQPTSYGWQPEYETTDCEIFCEPCLRTDLEAHIQRYLNNPYKASTILTHEDLIMHGFDEVNGKLQNGLHEGMNDNPKDIINKHKNTLENQNYIFIIPETSQFYITFELWARPKNYEHHE